jgi:hypothetical protein
MKPLERTDARTAAPSMIIGLPVRAMSGMEPDYHGPFGSERE